MSWHSLYVRPDPEKGVHSTEDLHALYMKVDEWLKANRSGSTRVKLLARDPKNPSKNRAEPLLIGFGRVSSSNMSAKFLQVKFRKDRDAVYFKMAFGDVVFVPTEKNSFGYDPVILPLIRRVMPNIIARDIIGCQPMTGPVAQMHTLRVRYEDTKPSTKTPSTGMKSKMQQLLENTRKELERLEKNAPWKGL